MGILEQSLFNYLIQNGVEQATAERAARKCAATVQRDARASLVIGTGLEVLAYNLASVLLGGVPAFSGDPYSVVESPSSTEIRDAAYRWSTRLTL